MFLLQKHMEFIYKAMVSICPELADLDEANHCPSPGGDMNNHHAGNNQMNNSPEPGDEENEIGNSLTHSLSHNQALNYYQAVQHRQWKGERPPRPETTI